MKMALTPNLVPSYASPIYMQLYQYIKSEIMNNRIVVNDQLPSVRNLATHLGISRTTIENAYQQLLAEGYIYSKPQRGYFVNQLEGTYLKNTKDVTSGIVIENETLEKQRYFYDFKSEYVEANNFDFNNWKKHLNYIINYQNEELYAYGDLQGEEGLRKAIVKYVHRTRGVNANENNLVIGAGVQPLLQILSTLFKKLKIQKIAMEDPGFNRAKHVFHNNDFEILPLKVTEHGFDLDQLETSHARLCYVSPSHQFPTGTVMRIDARSRLIKWANEQQGYIIEDDYNSELRYEGKPIPAMQGLDQNNRVIYLGSFSTVLVPTIRLSFMLLPQMLMDAYLEDQEKYNQTASKLEQLALSHMMASGDFEKHIRKIRKNYAKKSEFTLKLIQQYLTSYIDIIGVNSGLNILMKLKFECDENEIIGLLKKKSVLISSISEHTMQPSLPKPKILIMRFRGIPKERIEAGIREMYDVFCQYMQI